MTNLEQLKKKARERLHTGGVDGFAIDLDLDELDKVVEEAHQAGVDEAVGIVEKEQENYLRCLNECLMCCSIHMELQKDGSCADCSDALNANMMLYEAIKALTTLLQDNK